MAIGFSNALAVLKAAGEPTRLRLLALLQRGDLTVKDLTAVLGQSQPRISRHLKLLTEAGLVERYPEGAWAYYRLADDGSAAGLVRRLLDAIDRTDPEFARDGTRYGEVAATRAAGAARYFAKNAAEWDKIRSLHVAEDVVEAAMRAAIGDRPIQALLDLGTGTGRLLEVFAPIYERAIGIDQSPDMLAVARANLDRAGIDTARVQHGDIFNLPASARFYDLVTLHQVLHYLEEPGRAIAEATRALKPGGRLMVVDFAPHDLEFLREDHAHRRLGFSHEQVAGWITAAGLELVSVEDLPPPADRDGAKLTVTLWLARDPRIVVA